MTEAHSHWREKLQLEEELQEEEEHVEVEEDNMEEEDVGEGEEEGCLQLLGVDLPCIGERYCN